VVDVLLLKGNICVVTDGFTAQCQNPDQK